MTTTYEHLASHRCTAARGAPCLPKGCPAAGSSINPVMVIVLPHTTGQSWLALA
jgi:hypothetical protein